MWADADYERVAERFAAIHDELVAALEPAPGVRWLDVATGTGEVALRAARAGADVTGLDLSEGLLEQARAKVQAEGLPLTLDLGDAQALPYEDSSFDVVSSNFGVIFAPDHEAAANELARVCRGGGRLGVTVWRPKPALSALYERFQEEPPASQPEAWGDEERLRSLLGNAFELELHERVWSLEAESAEALWEFAAAAIPPLKAFAESLEATRRDEFRAAMVEYWRGFESDGEVSEPRPYLLVLGRRRSS